ncbi:MAG: hypothetical protein R2932_17525 [Caldilineaceae bacterium]
MAATLSRAEWHLLKECRASRKLSNEPELQRLLYKGALIEYANGVQWSDVHPVLWELLSFYTE